jgi:tetratricopeptide (TPR) repeat protein
MSKKSQQKTADKNLEGIEHALTTSEQFIEDHSKQITYVIFGIIVIVMIFIGLKRFYITPLEQEASSEMFMAEKFFEKDSFDYALNGYGNFPGFIQIIEDYGLTKSANLAKYYAGICLLNTGDFDGAIEYLEDFKTKDLLVGSAKYSSLGDAYIENGDLKAAINAYKTGIDKFPNDFSTPFLLKKMGIAYEEMKDFQKAVETYTAIKEKYSSSTEGRDIDKYIDRAKISS